MLKFHAKPGGLTAWPNSHFGGQARRYVGRQFVAPVAAKGDQPAKPAHYVVTTEPDQVAETDADASHLIRKCSRGELYAADQHTATVCGVEFVPLEKGQDGEWFPKKTKAEKPSKD